MNFQYLIPGWALANIGVVGVALIVAGVVPRRQGRVAWLRRAVMLVMVIAMGLAPAVPITATHETSNLAVFFVIDATGSMAAEDYNGDSPRTDGVRADALEIVENLPSAHYSIIEYSSTTSQQLPLTSDKTAVRTWLEGYDREFTAYSYGSSINRPVETVEEIMGRQDLTKYQPIVILMTDGESTNTSQTSRDEKPAFGSWSALFADGLVLGYGTEQGGRMRENELYPLHRPEYIIGPDKNVAISKANPGALQAAADQIGVRYVHRTSPGGMDEVLADIDVDSLLQEETADSRYSPIIWPFALAFALLMIWEIAHLAGHLRPITALSTKRQTLDTNRGIARLPHGGDQT
ncbi:vWA domain-containing protein [Trueperella bialowiezensis]|uniref:Uncharacterized protein encoded in toxicity protection region of plasmid R478, contains von Willebrand factor (VWF) domain n=1 Tax=Trueperella bialowiezensis TaxID=312285 RepID=A0A448PF34_9ACTO|nr:vWA domain-containing protein [Trueperella bialowiezensis]VEI13494.1 Uncharacterized protein encoded in toxicity protection region of plasmid R478, contains von Willebrand factor (vWF) domain [Trueperella bialowiezensis]